MIESYSVKIRIFGVLALVLSNLGFPSLAKATDGSVHNDNLHQLSIALHVAGEVTPLGSFALDGIEEDPIREFPWQVSLSFEPNFPHTVVIDFTVRILHTTLDIEETVAFNFQEIHATLDDGDLDLFLVNAPGGDSFVRFGGVLSAVHVPEPSTLALLLLSALFAPFGARAAQNRNC